MAGWSALTGGVIGVGVGSGAAAAIEPIMEPLRQSAWDKSRANLLELGVLARLVASGLVDRAAVLDDAHRLGFTDNRFDALTQLELKAPDVAELLEVWRRGLLGDPTSAGAIALVDHGLAKAQIEPHYWPAIKELFAARITPPTVALAVQRGVLHNARDPASGQTLLSVVPPSAGTTINFPAPLGLDPLGEARAWGYDFERLAVDARIAGIPPAPGELMQLLNRALINEADALTGIAQGDTRNEWAQVLLNLRHRVVSGVEAAELWVRGWVDQQASDQLGALDGWTPERMQLLRDLRGRPITVRQAYIGLARGGTYDGTPQTVPEPFQTALEQSNIRREWFSLAYQNRYSLPSAFVLRTLLSDGAIDTTRGQTILEHEGWPPDLAQLVATHYGSGTGSTGKQATKAELLAEYEGGYITQPEYSTALQALGYAGSALQIELELGDARQAKAWREKVVEAIHRAYLEHELGDTEAGSELATVAVTGELQTKLLRLWQLERLYTRTRLTEAQVVKAYGKGLIVEADALSRLRDFGLSPADAATRLAEG